MVFKTARRADNSATFKSRSEAVFKTARRADNQTELDGKQASLVFKTARRADN